MTVKDRAAIWVSLAAGVLLLAGLLYLTRERSLTGRNDFLTLYTGGTLAGTPGLYSMDANHQVHLKATGSAIDFVFFRPPFYAVLLKPFTWLPYRGAYALFQAVAFLAIALFLWRFGRNTPELFVFGALSAPLYCAFLNGQDSGIVTAIAGAAVLAMRRKQSTLAGLLFSLAAIKFHLFLLVPVTLLLHRRWDVLKGGAIGGAILVAISFLGGGLDWPQRYLAALRDPALHQSASNSATLRGMVEYWGGEGGAALTAASVVIVLLVVWIARRTADTEIALAAAIAGSLLVAFHATAHDMTVLLLPLALVLARSTDPPVRGMAALLASPILGIFVFLGWPFSLAAPATGCAFLMLMARSPQAQTTITRAEGLAS